jgi:hypothetical protein
MLSHFAECARQDWRDVLYWHESLPGDKGPASWEELPARLRLP